MTTTMTSLKDRYLEVRERIAAAAVKSGRTPGNVMLVAVTKTAEPDQIREVMRLGQVDFAENRVQQLMQKAAIIDEWLARHRAMPGVPWPKSSDDAVPDPRSLPPAAPMPVRGAAKKPASGPQAGSTPTPSAPGVGPNQVRWHMIGHLQRNKARKVVELCRLIHSVDSLRLVEELQLIGLKRDKPIDVLLQVNCSLEPQKYGCAIPAALHLAREIDSMIHVRLRGVMTMAPYSENPEDARGTFARCREVFDEIRSAGIGGGAAGGDSSTSRVNILSMGMSGDFEVAIEEGANLVRVGSAIFGHGTAPDEPDEDDEADD